MKTSKCKVKTALFMVIVSTTLCLLATGCQQTPSEEHIISKTENEHTTTSSETNVNSDTHGYTDCFTSLDGSVNIEFQVNNITEVEKMPNVEVVPHYLTEDEVKTIASLLFGDADFFDARMYTNVPYSKSEIQQRLNRWSQFANEDSAKSLYGEGYERRLETLKKGIEKYTAMYEDAPDEETRTPTDWKFKKDSFYYYPEGTTTSENLSADNDSIMLEVDSGNLQYILHASKRDSWDFKLSRVSAYLNPKGSPSQIDTRIFQSMLCRTPEPNEQQIEKLKQNVEDMLKQMNIGSWHIDQCHVEKQYYGKNQEYIVHINAIPVIANTVALRHPQLANLKCDDIYASNYYLTDAHFEYSANGDLIAFTLSSPIETKEVSENIPMLGTNELITKAREFLSLADIHAYDQQGIVQALGENVECTLRVSQMNYGLTRVKVPDSDESYYYIPSVAFYGEITYSDKESGSIYYQSEANKLLLTLNAADGTVISG